MPIVNRLVRLYLRQYKVQLDALRTRAVDLQKIQLESILSLKQPWARTFKRRKEFFETGITFYKDYSDTISNRIDNQNLRNQFGSIRYFMKSAGTSGQNQKCIPTSNEYLVKNHLKASWLTLYTLYSIKQDMDVFGCKNLLVGGAIYQDLKNTVIADVSGIMIKNIPKAFHRYHVPRIEDAIHPDWERKLSITAQSAAQTSDIVLFGGVPTWLITIFRRVLDISGRDHLLEIWPNLKAFLHGGVNFEPYKALFKELIPSDDFQYLEVYNASEGFIAAQDTRQNEGLLLMTAHAIYFEFILFHDYQSGEYEILQLGNVELDTDYVLLITNSSGLYRYVIGDVVRFVSMEPYRIIIVRRVEDYINAFGEDLTLSTLEQALTSVLMKHQSHIKEYTVAPVYLSAENKGRHQWLIEFQKKPHDIEVFSLDLDQSIRNLNFNYRQKRTKDIALSNLEIIDMPLGFFDEYAKLKGRFGGQYKLARLRNDRVLADELLKLSSKEMVL